MNCLRNRKNYIRIGFLQNEIVRLYHILFADVIRQRRRQAWPERRFLTGRWGGWPSVSCEERSEWESVEGCVTITEKQKGGIAVLEQTDFDMIKEKLQDDIETASLLKLAGTRKNSATVSFESMIKEEGMTVEEVEALETDVEIE